MKKIFMVVVLATLMLQAQTAKNETENTASKTSSNNIGFTVDGLKSGMHLNEILKMKFKKRADGQYSVLQGSTDFASEMLYGKDQSGEFLAYETKILGKKATVYLWLTQKSKRLYTARVEWTNLGLDASKNFRSSIKKALNKKYGNGKSEEKKDKEMFLLGRVWRPNDSVKITMRMSIGAGYSMGAYINYLDLKWQEKNKQEQSEVSDTSNQL